MIPKRLLYPDCKYSCLQLEVWLADNDEEEELCFLGGRFNFGFDKEECCLFLLSVFVSGWKKLVSNDHMLLEVISFILKM